MIYYRLKALDGDYEAAKALGYTAHHTSGGITILAFTRSPRFVGAVAQEYRELEREQVRGLTFGLPAFVVILAVALVAGAPLPFALIGGLLAAAAAYVFCQNDSLALEVWSHATTVQVNVLHDGMTLADAEAQSASSLQDADYGWKGETIEQLIAMMQVHYPDAKAWAGKNDALCRQWAQLKKEPW